MVKFLSLDYNRVELRWEKWRSGLESLGT